MNRPAWARTDAEIDRSTLWRWLEPRAKELARACYSGNYALPLSDYQSLMRLHASLLIERSYARGLAQVVRDQAQVIANEVLDQAMNEIGSYHAETQRDLRKEALAALRERGAPERVAERLVGLLDGRDPKLPLDYQREAMADAMREIRFEQAFARRSGRGA